MILSFKIPSIAAVALAVSTVSMTPAGGGHALAQSLRLQTQCDTFGTADLRAQCRNLESRDNTRGHFDPGQRPTQCSGYGNPDLRAQCNRMEKLTQSIGRYDAARRDAQNAKLSAAAREEDAACALTIKADVAAGRYSEHDVRVVRLGRAWRSIGYCNVLRQLQKP